MEQYVRDPSSYAYKLKNVETADYPFKLVEVQHMAGILPNPNLKNKNLQKTRVARYNESALDIYENQALHNKYLYLDDNDIDYNFFREQYEFLNSLSEEERGVLNVYSGAHGSDILNLVNNHKDDKDFLGGEFSRYAEIEHLGFIFKMFSPPNSTNPYRFMPVEPQMGNYNSIDEYMKAGADYWDKKRLYESEEEDLNKEKKERSYIIGMKYYETMNNIMKKAPTIKKQIRVFRGIKVSEYKRGYLPNIFDGFVSTSYDPDVAREFGDYEQVPLINHLELKRKNCCVCDILVKPGIKAIWLSPVSRFHTNVPNIWGKNNRSNTEREILLYCDEYVKTSFSHVHFKQILENDRIKYKNEEYITYDVTIEPKTKSILQRNKGQRRLTNKNWRIVGERRPANVERRSLAFPSQAKEGGRRKYEHKQITRKNK